MGSIYKTQAGRESIERFYRAVLQRWPVPNRQLVLPTCEGETFVVASGEDHAPAVVLLHGAGTNSGAWFRDVAEWSARFRIYAVDMIGEPGLSASSRPALSSDRYVAWLDDVWHGLGLTSAGVVGLSLGGWLRLDYAVRRPHRVSALSLVSPAGIGSRNGAFLLKAALLSMLGSWGIRRSFRLAAGQANVPRAVSDHMTRVFQEFRPRRERIPMRTDAELAALKMPVQLIVGGKDAMLRSNETRDRATHLIRDLELHYLENEGHFLPRQTDRIAAFLAGHVSQPLAAVS